MNNHTLTVIIPVTSAENKIKYLKNTLNKAFKCQYNVILVHDIKDSRSSLIINEIIKVYKNITLVEGYFGNAGTARNAGLKLVQTRWVVFWDSDDIIRLNEFQFALKKTVNEKSDIGIGNFDINDLSKKRKKQRSITNLDSNLIKYPGIWRYIFSYNFIKGIEFEDLLLGEDILFICEVWSRNPKISFTDKSIYSYSINFPGQTTSINMKYEQNILILSKLMKISNKSKTKNRNLIHQIYFRQSLSFLKRVRINEKYKATRFIFSNYVYRKNKLKINSIKYFTRSKVKLNIAKKKRAEDPTKLVLLHGGLGNQLFQLTEMLERFKTNDVAYVSFGNDIFSKFDLKCPSSETITENINLSRRITKLRNRKALNLILKLNYYIQSNNRLISLVAKVIERFYLLVLETTLFRKYSLVSDFRATTNIKFKKNKRYFFVGYFQFTKNSISTSTLDYLKYIMTNEYVTDIDHYIDLANLDQPLIMHVRLGDYSNFKNLQVISEDYFSRSINAIEANSLVAVKKIWIFSNDPEKAKEFLPERISSISETIETYSDEFLDFQIMRLGDMYIISNSTFSWWAAKLSFCKNPIVVAPNTWFNDQKQPKNLLPKEWISV
jgi:hypothetical protein